MADVNKVIIIGRAGRDPEIRTFPDGGCIANLTVATSRRWKDKKSGEMVERTEWNRVVFRSRLAEIVGEYVRKGKQVYVEGTLETRKWHDKEGRDNYTTEIVAEQMQLLGGRDDDAPAPREQQARRQEPTRTQAPARQAAPATGFEDMDSDIPF